MESKYKKLLSNTVLFTISSFASKVLSIVIKPLLTYWLNDPSMNGIANLVTQSGNLLIPLVSLGIANAVIRFGLDKSNDKRHIFTNGLLAILTGTGLMLLLYPALSRLPDVGGYVLLLYIFVPNSCLRTLCCQFTRAQEHNRLYALDGVLCTAVTFFFYYLYFTVLHMGPEGYIVGMISADACSTVFLVIAGKLWRFIDFKHINKALFRQMMRYALPLMPASMFWWVTNVSDQFFISYMLPDGLYWNGIYTQSYVLPTLMTIISTIFTEAWQLSAFTDGMQAERETFFSRVFSAYQSVIYMAGAGIILISPLYARTLSAEYRSCWLFVPMLSVAMVFASFNNFMNSIYMAAKRSSLSFITMGMGALTNLLLNWILIPLYGANGAAIATFASYLVVFVIRVINTRHLIRMNIHWGKMALNFALILAESFCLLRAMRTELPLYWLLTAGLFLALVGVDMRGFIQTITTFIRRRKGKA